MTDKETIIYWSRSAGKVTLAQILKDLMDLEQSNPSMYFFAMEMLLEHVLTTIKRLKKEAKQVGK